MSRGESWTRRRLLKSAAAARLAWAWPASARPATTPFPVHFRKPAPYEDLRGLVEAGHDEFAKESEAEATEARWNRLLAQSPVPLTGDFRGYPPLPARYQQIAEGVLQAEFTREEEDFQAGWRQWIASLGDVRSARFF